MFAANQVTVTPLSLLGSSLVGALFLNCLKFLLLDYYPRRRELISERRHLARVLSIKLERTKARTLLVDKAENQVHDESILLAEPPEEFSQKVGVVERIIGLYELEGRLQGMSDDSLFSFEVCRRALFESASNLRGIYQRLLDGTLSAKDISLDGSFLRITATSAQVNEAIKELSSNQNVFIEENKKEIDDLDTEIIKNNTKAAAALLCAAVILLVSLRWLVSF